MADKQVLIAALKQGTNERRLYKLAEKLYSLIVEKFALMHPDTCLCRKETNYTDISEALDALNHSRVR